MKNWLKNYTKQLLENFKKEPSILDLKIILRELIQLMQITSKFNKGFRFLLCVIDIFIKYAWVIPSKDKKGLTIINAFQKILKESNRKPNKIWVN